MTASLVADWSLEVQWQSKRTFLLERKLIEFPFDLFIGNLFVCSRLWNWSGVGHAVTNMATPPESPHPALMRDTSLQYEDAIIPELDIYAIPSKEGTFSQNKLSIYLSERRM